MTITVNQKIAQTFKRPASEWFAKRHMEWNLLRSQMAALSTYTAGKGGAERDYKVYFVPGNVTDTLTSNKLAECPEISCSPVSLPENYKGTWNQQPGWDHSVIEVMRLGESLNATTGLNQASER